MFYSSLKRYLITIYVSLLISLTPTAEAKTIVVFGDSISAAYGIEVNLGWVNLLSDRLKEQYPHYKVINASVSGETTGGGMIRLPKTLALHQPEILVLELGGNDGLRGYPIEKIASNLSSMISAAETANSQVLLIGMVLPPNYGHRYTLAFEHIFSDLAEQYDLPFVPFLLEGASTDRKLIQRDGIHPTVSAQPRLLEDVWPALQPLLKEAD